MLKGIHLTKHKKSWESCSDVVKGEKKNKKQSNMAGLTLSWIWQVRAIHCPQSSYCSNKLKRWNSASKHWKLLTITALAPRKEKSNSFTLYDMLCSDTDNRPKVELLRRLPTAPNWNLIQLWLSQKWNLSPLRPSEINRPALVRGDFPDKPLPLPVRKSNLAITNPHFCLV